MSATTYTVWYRLDDARGTKGRCQTDHHIDTGEAIYAKQGRATVICCRENRSVDATFSGKNGYLLKSIASARP